VRIHCQAHRDDDEASAECPTKLLVAPVRRPEVLRHERDEGLAGRERRLDYLLPGERWLDFLMGDETRERPTLECRGDRTDQLSVSSRMAKEETDSAGGPDVEWIIEISCPLWLCQRRCLGPIDGLSGRLNAIAYTTKPCAYAAGVFRVLWVVVEDGLDQSQETRALIGIGPINRS